MPVANLQSYRTVGLRVKGTAFASQGQAMALEAAVFDKLRQQCGFEQVGAVGATPADVVLDLNITALGRGGSRIISNPNLATIDTLLVLTDGQTTELLGTARIHGESSGLIINNAMPETEAVEVVAKTIADLLAKSGCSGARIARVEPATTDTGSGSSAGAGAAADPTTTTKADEAHRAEAETLNDEGKEKLRTADIPGAVAAFQQANTLVPDARYAYNLCLAFEAQEHWDDAIAACRKAHDLNPPAKLVAKIDRQIELLQHRE